MTPELATVLERVRQNRAARARQAPATSLDTRTPGVRVFDTVTGEQGEVLGGGTENIIVPVAERAAR